MCKPYVGHTESCARDRDERSLMLAIMINYQGANAIENRYSDNPDKIRNIFYHGEKSRWGINCYVLEHKNCHKERYQLVAHNYHDFTDREKCLLPSKGHQGP